LKEQKKIYVINLLGYVNVNVVIKLQLEVIYLGVVKLNHVDVIEMK